jgi:TetR/AcrR family fatty acid metabolism transcriptional regulator
MDQEIKIPRKVRSQQVKNRIFETAVQLIKDRGFDYVTVANVCAGANVSVGSFYHYFSGKEELLSYYFVAGYNKYFDNYSKKMGQDFIRNICLIFDIYSQFCLDQGLQFISNFYSPTNKSLDIYKDNVDDEKRLPLVSKAYHELLAAQEKGYIQESADLEQISYDLCILEKGGVLEWAVSDGKYDLKKHLSRMIVNMLTGITTEKYRQKFEPDQ